MVVAPVAATPIANPAMPYSLKGVLNTLSVPYFSFNSTVHLNTPPNLTSSPNIIALLFLVKVLPVITTKCNV